MPRIDTLKTVVLKTPLQYHRKLPEKFKAEIYLKREDLQCVPIKARACLGSTIRYQPLVSDKFFLDFL